MAEFRNFELRQEGRVLSGTAIQYGEIASMPFGRERFEPGAFRGVESADVILNASHDRARPLARTGGAGLVVTDSREALKIRAELPETRESDDVLTLIKTGVLRGLSLEFRAVDERLDGGDIRVVERAELRGVGVVDRPAYKGSVVSARFEVRQQGRGLAGRFEYNRARIISNRGRRRKSTIRPGAFRFTIEDESYEINLLLGRDYDQVLASRNAGTLQLADGPDALSFTVDQLPDTTYARDFLAALAGSAILPGVVALYSIPPPEIVPDAVEIVPEPDNPGVDVEYVNAALLTALGVVSRQPRGNPGEVAARAAERDPIGGKPHRRRRVWL